MAAAVTFLPTAAPPAIIATADRVVAAAGETWACRGGGRDLRALTSSSRVAARLLFNRLLVLVLLLLQASWRAFQHRLARLASQAVQQPLILPAGSCATAHQEP